MYASKGGTQTHTHVKDRNLTQPIGQCPNAYSVRSMSWVRDPTRSLQDILTLRDAVIPRCCQLKQAMPRPPLPPPRCTILKLGKESVCSRWLHTLCCINSTQNETCTPTALIDWLAGWESCCLAGKSEIWVLHACCGDTINDYVASVGLARCCIDVDSALDSTEFRS